MISVDKRGWITISHVSSNVREDFVHVEIDTHKGRILLEMELKDYARMITGLSRQPVIIKDFT